MEQKNKDDLFGKLNRHIERCEKCPGYKVYFYVKKENAKQFAEDVMRNIVDRITTEYCIVAGKGMTIKFPNGSIITARAFGEELRAVKMHVLFVDNKIREKELRLVATGSIIQYETETGAFLTPKPIFFNLD